MHEEVSLGAAQSNLDAIIQDVDQNYETYVITGEDDKPLAVIVSYLTWQNLTEPQ